MHGTRTDARRIAVVGNSGSGKSTLCQQLGIRLNLPVWHIDRIFWTQNWVLADDTGFERIHAAWLREAAWVIDGVGSWASLTQRIDAAELVLYLETPLDLCLKRAADRMAADLNAPNPFIAEGCRYRHVQDRQREVIYAFERDLRPALFDLFAQLPPAKVQTLDGRLTVRELVASV